MAPAGGEGGERDMDGGADYRPLDLGALCNAQAASIAGMRAPAGAPTAEMVAAVTGRQTFRGLPFLVGREMASSGEPDLIILGGGARGPMSIRVAASARWLIFVHRLLETNVYGGAPVGSRVAEYAVRYEDGWTERIPIRERFEIAFPDERWTQLPFLGWWDCEYELPPRLAGPWADAGTRQTESAFPGTPSWTLFPWRNPRPSVAIAAIDILPAGPQFTLGALTLGMLDEHPIRATGARDVVVTLDDPPDGGPVFGGSGARITDAAAVAGLSISVDRGLAGYSFALPVQGPDAFLADPVRGFGEPANNRPSPTVARIAAVPSATLRLRLGERELAAVRWDDLLREGRSAGSAGVRIEVVDPGRNWVRTTVIDDATGEVMPCRVHFRSPHGIPFAPHGHHAYVNSNNGSWHQDVGGDVRLGQISYAYIDGRCEGWLPRGDVLVDVAQGFEYLPLRARVRVEPGQQELTLRLRRFANRNAEGWYSGDTHVHFLSPSGGATEARGEGLNVVNLLQAQWGSLFTNTEDFTGAPYVHSDGRTIVYASQENRQHVSGHMSLLGLKRPVMPWSSDGLGEAELGGTMETTMSDWADRAHAQGGTVVTPHFPSPNGETATLVATGRTDAIEMIRFGRYEHASWYRYLNAGYRIPVVGGTDKMSADTPVGLYRTYVRLLPGEAFTYDAWCAGLRAGRTFHSGGPLVQFTVDGREVGETVALRAGGGTVEVVASAESIFPIEDIEIVHDGRVVASSSTVEVADGLWRLSLRQRVRVESHGWLAARVGGKGYWETVRHHDSWARPVFAHTSPVYVSAGGEWWRHDEDVAGGMLALIDGALGYIRDVSAQALAGSVTHHHGEADHQAFLERPYRQAIAAIEARRRAPRAGDSNVPGRGRRRS
jgi:hypothetical protein